MLRVVLRAVTGTVPNHANISQLIINTVIAILLSIPLYLIDAALLLSNHGTTNSIAIAAPFKIVKARQGKAGGTNQHSELYE